MSCYATVAEFYRFGIAKIRLGDSVTDDDILAVITAWSARADSHFGARFTPPLTVWGDDVRQAVCACSAYDVVAAQVGFNPEDGRNMVLVDRKTDATRWFEQVSRGQVTPVGITDSSSNSPSGVPSARAFSNPPRGW